MNANELADLIECACCAYQKEAATMLRQQKNEIEDLKNANRFVQNFAEEQHQRAVALESELDRAVELYTDKAIENEALEKELTEAGGMIGVLREYISDLENGLDSSIKLNKAQAERTHPVKELTDEEILQLRDKVPYSLGSDLIDFARAILRKAQE